jgi:hypothetical protein
MYLSVLHAGSAECGIKIVRRLVTQSWANARDKA